MDWDTAVEEAGWDLESQIFVLLRYIEQQDGKEEAFSYYLDEQVQGEAYAAAEI